MYNIKELYLRALDKLNKLISNNEQDVPEYIFVYNFNEAQNHWVANNYKLDEFNRPISENLDDLLIKDFSLKPTLNNRLYTTFERPADYLYYNDSYTVIDTCPYLIENNLKRNQDSSYLIKDSEWTPSLKFEHTFITLNDNKINVYHNGEFLINEIKLTYYKKPTPVDMEDGHTHLDGRPTQDVNPIWNNQIIVDEILDLTCELISSNYSDVNRAASLDKHSKETQQQILK
jgi:hypothetical protein